MSGSRVPTWRRATGVYPIVALCLLVVILAGWKLLGGNGPPPEQEAFVNDAFPAQIHRTPPPPAPPQALPVQDTLVPQQGFETPPPVLPAQTVSAAVVLPPENGALVRHFGNQSSQLANQDRGDAGSGAGADRRPQSTVSYKPAQVQGSEVGVVTDRSRTLKPTTIVPCVLDVAIDGTHAGPLVCHVKFSIKGWDPTTVLLPKDTPVSGTYEPLSVGQGRMMAMAANAYTSEGLIVPLGSSPMTDELGRIGMPGHVDNRWMERIGNAVITDAALSAINLPAAALQSRSNGINFNTNSTEGVVNSVLQSTLNLPPIFRKNVGEEISILITSPVHFGALRYEAVR